MNPNTMWPEMVRLGLLFMLFSLGPDVAIGGFKLTLAARGEDRRLA